MSSNVNALVMQLSKGPAWCLCTRCIWSSGSLELHTIALHMEPSRLHLLPEQDTCRPSSCLYHLQHLTPAARRDASAVSVTCDRKTTRLYRLVAGLDITQHIRTGGLLSFQNRHVPIALQTFHFECNVKCRIAYAVILVCKRQRKLTTCQPSGRCPGLAATASHAGCSAPPASATKVKMYPNKLCLVNLINVIRLLLTAHVSPSLICISYFACQR